MSTGAASTGGSRGWPVPALGAILAEPLYNLRRHGDRSGTSGDRRLTPSRSRRTSAVHRGLAWPSSCRPPPRPRWRGTPPAAGTARRGAPSAPPTRSPPGGAPVTSAAVILHRPAHRRPARRPGRHRPPRRRATSGSPPSACPSSTCLYAGNGHLIGLENTRTPLLIAVGGANVVNVALEIAFVFGLHARARRVGVGHGYRAGARRGGLRVRVQAVAVPAGQARPPATSPPCCATGKTSCRCGRIALGVVPLRRDGRSTARLGPVPPGRAARSPTGCGRLLSLATDALAVARAGLHQARSSAAATGRRPSARRGARSCSGSPSACGLAALTAALALFAPALFHHRPDGAARRGHRAACGPRQPSRSPRSRSSTTASSSPWANYHRHAPRDAAVDSWPSLRSPAWCSGSPPPLARALPGVWTALGCGLAARTVPALAALGQLRNASSARRPRLMKRTPNRSFRPFPPHLRHGRWKRRVETGAVINRPRP